jgi:hypothetical protein
MSGDAGLLERQGIMARADAAQWPRRYLAYMAGISVRLLLPLIQELVVRLGQQVESVVFVVGDRWYFRWAQQWAREHQMDQRITLVYQHERLDPFRHPARLDLDRLADWEQCYGAPNLWRYILVHRMIDHMPDEEKLRYLQTYLEDFHGGIEVVSPDLSQNSDSSGEPDSL